MNKQNIPLVVGITLPLVLVVLVAIAVYLPRTFADPQYDFVYVVNDRTLYDRECETYVVDDAGQLTIEAEGADDIAPRRRATCVRGVATWYLYDVSAKEERKVTFDALEDMSLSDEPISPDGYWFVRDYSHSGIFELFGSNNRNEWFLENNSVRIPLDVSAQQYPYDVSFIGWVIE